MKTNSVNLYLIKILIIIVVAINFQSCASKSAKSELFTQEDKIFKWYMNGLKQKIESEKHYYYIISHIGCHGCKINLIAYFSKLENVSDSITFIVDSRNSLEYKTLLTKTIVDTTNLIGSLNWKYTGIIYIETEDSNLKNIHSIDTDEILNIVLDK